MRTHAYSFDEILRVATTSLDFVLHLQCVFVPVQQRIFNDLYTMNINIDTLDLRVSHCFPVEECGHLHKPSRIHLPPN